MSDVNCQVCEEPWDLHNGEIDALKWESRLFLAGAGCPSCEGEDGKGDSGLRRLALHDVLPRQPWERPEGKLLWQCTGCEVEVRVNPDDEETIEWCGGQRVHYRAGRGPFTWDQVARDDPTETAPFLIGGEEYCSGCAEWCGECCEEAIFSRSELYGDTYDAGASFPHPHRYDRALCLTCFEELSEEEVY